ncbi:hypothetical protein Tco_0727073 [Tanacetum coccineum]|uniref:Uncharacterized protein n=1 Tax=Tanacetum coccineum TaxID=301880 RepID=A0ABQ4YIA8_9ASTR
MRTRLQSSKQIEGARYPTVPVCGSRRSTGRNPNPGYPLNGRKYILFSDAINTVLLSVNDFVPPFPYSPKSALKYPHEWPYLTASNHSRKTYPKQYP